MTTPAAPATPKKTATKQTTFVVLEFNEKTDEWREHGDKIAASNRDAATRKYASLVYPERIGAIVAIPARSWKPRKITVETKTTIKLG